MLGWVKFRIRKESFCLLANKEFCVLKTSRKWKKALDGRTYLNGKGLKVKIVCVESIDSTHLFMRANTQWKD